VVVGKYQHFYEQHSTYQTYAYGRLRVKFPCDYLSKIPQRRKAGIAHILQHTESKHRRMTLFRSRFVRSTRRKKWKGSYESSVGGKLFDLLQDTVRRLQGSIRKFPDWVDNVIYAYNTHSLRSNTKGYGGKTHYTDSQNSDITAASGRQLYHLQFSLQAVSPGTFEYTLVFKIGYNHCKSQSGQVITRTMKEAQTDRQTDMVNS
jgi:hypothetical protein